MACVTEFATGFPGYVTGRTPRALRSAAATGVRWGIRSGGDGGAGRARVAQLARAPLL